MLLRQIKSESYGVLRYKPFRPSLSAENNLKGINQVPFFHAWYSTRYLYNMLIVNVLENRNF